MGARSDVVRFCTFSLPGEDRKGWRAGVVREGKVFEVEGKEPMAAVLREEWGDIRASKSGYDLDGVALHAPIPRPGKILAAIVNTPGMLGGTDASFDRPRIDMKAPSTVVGPGETVRAPRTGIRPEVELAAIVGKRMSGATAEEASMSIFGFTILNDITAPADSRADAYEAYRRDRATGEIRKATMRGPLFRSKNHDTFCPMGPWAVTPDEIDVSKGLRMTAAFDGELVQDGSTAEYIFGPAAIASYISGFLTLEPGDVVSCGSVGWTREAIGNFDPTEFILPSKEGTLDLEIEGLGRLSNPVALVEWD